MEELRLKNDFGIFASLTLTFDLDLDLNASEWGTVKEHLVFTWSKSDHLRHSYDKKAEHSMLENFFSKQSYWKFKILLDCRLLIVLQDCF